MILPQDAALLAYAKIRTRKVRLFITVFISCLLFTGLITASLVVRGVFHSIESFSQEGLGQRYVVMAMPQSPADNNPFQDKTVTARAEVLQKELVAKKTAEAKRLGIEYVPANEPPAVVEYDGPKGKERSVSPDSSSGKKALVEYAQARPIAGEDKLRSVAAKYQTDKVYKSISLSYNNPFVLQVLKNGKENFDDKKRDFNPMQRGVDGFTTSWQVMSQELLEPFTLPNQSLAMNDDRVPVLAPYTAVEEILQLKPLPATATNQQKLDRLKEVRGKAAGLEFSVCYRNETSNGLLNQAKTVQAELTKNKNNKDYQKPDLIYDLPDKSCGPVRVSRDVRTADRKKQDAKQEEFDRIFGKTDAVQTTLKFRIAGVVPDPPDYGAISISQIITTLVGSSVGSGWFTPNEVLAKNSLVNDMFTSQNTSFSPDGKRYYVEFPSTAVTKQFIEKENCASADIGPPPPAGITTQFSGCDTADKPFSVTGFGSSSLALESAQKWFAKFFSIAALVLAAIASLILMGIVGKIIADSRRETAVFRAIGAKKTDIAQIYFTYTLYVATLVSAAALVVGMTLAHFADSNLSPKVTVDALVAYNASDLSRRFGFFALHGRDLLYVVGLIVAASILSACLPLLTNIRRNPIKDMRDEG